MAKLHAGSATRSDSLRSLVTLGSTQLDLIQAQTDLATAEAGLARLVGQTGRVRALDDSSFRQVVATVDTAALRQEAEARSPRIQTAVASTNVAQANLRASRAAYWPSLTLGASTSWNGSRSHRLHLPQPAAGEPGAELETSSTGSTASSPSPSARRASTWPKPPPADERRAVDAELTQRARRARRGALQDRHHRHQRGGGHRGPAGAAGALPAGRLDHRGRTDLAGSPQPGGGGRGERPVRLPPRQGAARSADRTDAVTASLGDTAERMAMLPADVPRDAVIVTRNLQRDYDMGGEIVHALRGVDLVIRKNEFVAIMGAVGLGQVHADEPDRLPRQPDGRRVLAQRPPGVGAGRRRAGADPEQGDRLRVPDLQPAAPRHRAPQRRAAAGLRRARRRRSGATRRPTRSRASAWRTGCSTGRTSSRAASGSAWRSRARWSTSRASCWPTSRPATSTAARARRSWRLFEGLHRDGQTIVLVTHETDIAAHAQRQVHLKDGRMERDFASGGRRERCRTSGVVPGVAPAAGRRLFGLGPRVAGRADPVHGLQERRRPRSSTRRVPVERRDIIVNAQAAGAIQPDTTVEVKSKASGEVLQLNAETGQLVKRGALLVHIDPRNARNALAQAQANLDVARGQARQRHQPEATGRTSCSRRRRSPRRSTSSGAARLRRRQVAGGARPGCRWTTPRSSSRTPTSARPSPARSSRRTSNAAPSSRPRRPT